MRFIGFECKYTDTFSFKRPQTNIFYGADQDKNYDKYFNLFSANRQRFPDDYFSYIRSKHFGSISKLMLDFDSEYEFDKTTLSMYYLFSASLLA